MRKTQAHQSRRARSKNEAHFDVIIVGAGLSGIGAAHHLQARRRSKSYAILESRQEIGGTWDLFRYPGIRSDSDMYTLGYGFRPWTGAKAIADGASIRAYIQDTARERGIEQHIRFGHKVLRAAWSSADAVWSVEVERADGSLVVFSCSFLFACTGYYDYASGHLPDFPGRERFAGQLIHAQHWPDDLSYADKSVVVIGSGATAMTLVPALARYAAQVTMLQRTPTYVVSRPARDDLADRLRNVLPAMLAYRLIRWRNILASIYFFNLARKRPQSVRQRILEGIRAHLGPDFDIATHFAPPYDPWDQRLCLVPDGDLFDVLNSGKATVVTDHIDTFTPEGIQLRSGNHLDADLIVAATGLRLQLLGGVELSLDGQPLNLSQAMTYKGCLYSDVPNFAFCFGYTNASWTLKCDLTCDYVCRLLNLMDQRGYTSVAPRRRDPSLAEEPMLDFSSGYVQRAIARFPKQGSKPPWKMHQNYVFDLLALRHGALNDGALDFQ